MPEQVIVPDVTGAERSTAIAALKRTGLLAEEQAKQVDSKQVGMVVSQEPKAGTSVKAGSLVTITVGIAAESVAVPDVVGIALAKRRRHQARPASGRSGRTTQSPGNDGVVLGQTPKAERTWHAVLSRGPESEAAGHRIAHRRCARPQPPTIEDARQKLDEQKLKLGKVSTKATTANQVGLVLSQSPKAGTKAAPQSEVAVVIGGKEGGGSSSQNPVEETIQLVAAEPDFEKVGASEPKLARIAEEEGLKTQDALRKFVETKEDAEVRDRFKLPNPRTAPAPSRKSCSA